MGVDRFDVSEGDDAFVKGLGRGMERLNRTAMWSEMVRSRPYRSSGAMPVEHTRSRVMPWNELENSHAV